jgi:hypothetical protein
MNNSATLHRRLVGAATVLAAAVLTGCGSATEDTIQAGDRTSGGQQRPDRATPAPTPSARESRESTDHTTQEGSMQIQIRVGVEQFTASIDDTPAGRDLLAQLPQTIQMTDHDGVEKTGPLASTLSLGGQPAGADPQAGDLGYYAPGQDLVFYYGDQPYYDGIVVLGRLDPDAPSRLGQMTGEITAAVTGEVDS